MTDPELRQEVIDLNNALFEWKISDEEENVSAAVMLGIVGLYADGDGSPYEAARIAEECVNNMQEENAKLEICRELLQGQKVRIPGMDEDFCVWELFYDLSTGDKIINDDTE